MTDIDYALAEVERMKAGRSKKEQAEIMGIVQSTYRRNSNNLPSNNGNGHGHAVSATVHPEASVELPPHRPRSPRRLCRAAVFDIETQNFNAIGYSGVFVCGCILPTDTDEVITSQLSYRDRGDDRRALTEFIGKLWEFDILIGHNVIAFDLNWVNTRRMYYGMPDLRSWMVFDTYQAARSIAMASGGKSLGNLTDVFGLDGEKTTIRETSWSKARSSRSEEFEAAMGQIVYHCQQDVIAQRNLFDTLMSYSMTLAQPQFKMTKWKTGIPAWENWQSQWRAAQRSMR